MIQDPESEVGTAPSSQTEARSNSARVNPQSIRNSIPGDNESIGRRYVGDRTGENRKTEHKPRWGLLACLPCAPVCLSFFNTTSPVPPATSSHTCLCNPTNHRILAPLVVLQFAFPVLGQVIVTGAEATDTWVPATSVLPSCRVNKPDGVTLAPGTRAGKTREQPPSPT
ncbi:hypothetical protein BDP67DRAFT_561438 [Colletotrichum lupini]|nr:hypothetical protein BDP67DRAFT_561438 [Colletotrichum lupini]